MKKRILVVLMVGALMVAMAMPALAVPPSSGETGCAGGTNNAGHAIDGPTGAPSWNAPNNPVDEPSRAGEAPGTQNNPGFDTASDTRGVSGRNCPE
jgi:hypothetical protein